MKRSFFIQHALLPLIILALAAGTASGQMYSDISTILPVDSTGIVRVYYSTKDNDGSLIVTGNAERGGGLQLSSGSGPTIIDTTTAFKTFIAKRRSNGTWAWVKILTGLPYYLAGPGNSIGRQTICGVVTDPQGNIFITGHYTGLVAFDNFTFRSTIYNWKKAVPDCIMTYETDLFVAKMDSNGVFQWVKTEGTNKGMDAGMDIAIDGDGNVIVTGFYANSNQSTQQIAPVLCTDLYVAKYNGAGVKQWSKNYGNTAYVPTFSQGWPSLTQINSNSGNAVKTDASGNIYIGGQFIGTLTIGSSTITAHAAKRLDGCVVKLNANGTPQWVRTAYSTSCSDPYRITRFTRCRMDAAGNPSFLCENGCGGNLMVNNVPYTNMQTGTLVKLDGSGALLSVNNVANYPTILNYLGLGTTLFSGYDRWWPRSFVLEPSGNIDILNLISASGSGGPNFLTGYNSSGVFRFSTSLRWVNDGDIFADSTGVTVAAGFRSYDTLNTASGPVILSTPGIVRRSYGVFIANYDPGVPKVQHQGEDDTHANGISLSQNYPNPVSSREATTTITYSLDNEGPVVMKVYNALGREVATLVNESLGAGTHTASFNAGSLGLGVYTYELTVAGQRQSRKMLLVK
jgi:hypothetical protein